MLTYAAGEGGGGISQLGGARVHAAGKAEALTSLNRALREP
jgi:hypothetical protein